MVKYSANDFSVIRRGSLFTCRPNAMSRKNFNDLYFFYLFDQYYRSSHCRCQNGTFRNNDGLCVSPSDCPILDEPCRGGPNDYLILDVDLHEPTCDRPYIGIVLLNVSIINILQKCKFLSKKFNGRFS